MIANIKWLPLLIGNSILIFLIQLVNDTLAPTTIHLYPLALFIFAPLILLPFTAGLISVIFTGLFLDASAYLPLGITTLILAFVYTACSWLRHQFKAYSGQHNMLIIQSANAVIWAFLSVFIREIDHTKPQYWISVFSNLLLSQITILVITSWFLNLQNSLLNLFNTKFKPVNE